jgi:hypothetical protein
MNDDWQPMDDAPDMICVLLAHPYYSHGRVRHGYRNRKGEWIGVNADGTEGRLNFDPAAWMFLPSARKIA